MNEFTIDFPLILVGLVFGSGLLWLLDALFLAPGRRRTALALQDKYPQWEQEGSTDEARYQAQLADTAPEPVVVPEQTPDENKLASLAEDKLAEVAPPPPAAARQIRSQIQTELNLRI